MEKYLYDYEKRELFIYDSLTTHQFNETGTFIIERYLKHVSVSQIAIDLVKEFQLDLIEANQDVQDFINELQAFEVFPEKNKLTVIQEKQSAFAKVATNFQLHTPIIHVIQNCNSPCKMCDCWQTKEKIWHSAAILKPFFKKIKESGAVAVMISGGEPLLHPEIEQILADLSEIGLKIMLNTNALLLRQHLHLSAYPIDQLVVSMDGYDAATYQNYRGLNGYDIVWKNLTLFQEKSPQTKIGIRTILNRHNYDKVDLLFEAIESRQMHSVGLSPADVTSESFSRTAIHPEKVKFLTDFLIPTEEQILQFLEDFTPTNSYFQKIERAYAQQLSSWSANDFIRCMNFYLSIHRQTAEPFLNEPCVFPKTSLVLDYNGDLRNCFYSPAFGNLYKLDEADWNFTRSMKELEVSRKCQSCRGKVFCGTEMAKL